MTSTTRTECVEVLMNEEEKSGLSALCRMLGVPISTYLRGLGNREVQRNGMPPAPPRESRGCRGVGRAASRGSAPLLTRRQV